MEERYSDLSEENSQGNRTDAMRPGTAQASSLREAAPSGIDAGLAPDKSVPAGSPPADNASGRAVGKAASPSAPAQIAAKTPVRSPNAVRRIEQRLTVVPLGRDHKRSEREAGHKVALPPLPGGKTKRAYGAYVWFSICVVIPTIAALIYFSFIASEQYSAEFRFTVTDTSAPEMPAASGLLSILGGVARPNSNDDYMVTDYITSPQAVQDLQDRIKIKNLYAKPNIDWWWQFDSSESIERFLSYWKSMVTARFDVITGIASAEVRAFSPEDAQLIANTLVTLSEQLVNQIANRSAIDAVQTAAQQVERAQNRLKEIRVKLTAYRNKFGIIDPTTSITASNSSLIETLRANLSRLETQLETLKSQNLLPNAPAIVTLNSQIKSTKEQLANTEAQVGHGEAGHGLSATVGEYEQLNFELQYAQAALTAMMQSLDQARANAAVQHVYITPYIRPGLPQSARYPSRILSTMTAGMVGFAFWILSLMIIRSIRERFG